MLRTSIVKSIIALSFAVCLLLLALFQIRQTQRTSSSAYDRCDEVPVDECSLIPGCNITTKSKACTMADCDANKPGCRVKSSAKSSCTQFSNQGQCSPSGCRWETQSHSCTEGTCNTPGCSCTPKMVNCSERGCPTRSECQTSYTNCTMDMCRGSSYCTFRPGSCVGPAGCSGRTRSACTGSCSWSADSCTGRYPSGCSGQFQDGVIVTGQYFTGSCQGEFESTPSTCEGNYDVPVCSGTLLAPTPEPNRSCQNAGGTCMYGISDCSVHQLTTIPNQSCQGGAPCCGGAIPTSQQTCHAGSIHCEGNELVVCNSTGTQATRTVCPSGTTCQGNRCLAPASPTPTPITASSTIAPTSDPNRACQNAGGNCIYGISSCSVHQLASIPGITCQGGAPCCGRMYLPTPTPTPTPTMTPTPTPNANRLCEQQGGQCLYGVTSCDTQGLTSIADARCEGGAVCCSRQAIAGSKQICVPNSRSCVGRTLRVCDNYGVKLTETQCGEGKACDEKRNVCVDDFSQIFNHNNVVESKLGEINISNTGYISLIGRVCDPSKVDEVFMGMVEGNGSKQACRLKCDEGLVVEDFCIPASQVCKDDGGVCIDNALCKSLGGTTKGFSCNNLKEQCCSLPSPSKIITDLFITSKEEETAYGYSTNNLCSKYGGYCATNSSCVQSNGTSIESLPEIRNICGTNQTCCIPSTACSKEAEQMCIGDKSKICVEGKWITSNICSEGYYCDPITFGCVCRSGTTRINESGVLEYCGSRQRYQCYPGSELVKNNEPYSCTKVCRSNSNNNNNFDMLYHDVPDCNRDPKTMDDIICVDQDRYRYNSLAGVNEFIETCPELCVFGKCLNRDWSRTCLDGESFIGGAGNCKYVCDGGRYMQLRGCGVYNFTGEWTNKHRELVLDALADFPEEVINILENSDILINEFKRDPYLYSYSFDNSKLLASGWASYDGVIGIPDSGLENDLVALEVTRHELVHEWENATNNEITDIFSEMTGCSYSSEYNSYSYSPSNQPTRGYGYYNCHEGLAVSCGETYMNPIESCGMKTNPNTSGTYEACKEIFGGVEYCDEKVHPDERGMGLLKRMIVFLVIEFNSLQSKVYASDSVANLEDWMAGLELGLKADDSFWAQAKSYGGKIESDGSRQVIEFESNNPIYSHTLFVENELISYIMYVPSDLIASEYISQYNDYEEKLSTRHGPFAKALRYDGGKMIVVIDEGIDKVMFVEKRLHDQDMAESVFEYYRGDYGSLYGEQRELFEQEMIAANQVIKMDELDSSQNNRISVSSKLATIVFIFCLLGYILWVARKKIKSKIVNK